MCFYITNYCTQNFTYSCVCVCVYCMYFNMYPPHIIKINYNRCVYIYIFPVPRIVGDTLNIWEDNDIFLF